MDHRPRRPCRCVIPDRLADSAQFSFTAPCTGSCAHHVAPIQSTFSQPEVAKKLTSHRERSAVRTARVAVRHRPRTHAKPAFAGAERRPSDRPGCLGTRGPCEGSSFRRAVYFHSRFWLSASSAFRRSISARAQRRRRGTSSSMLAQIRSSAISSYLRRRMFPIPRACFHGASG
jgi:hypothetical protein